MSIQRVVLTDFTIFRLAELELSPGINVLIGENSTGKTHVMKALYSVVRAVADAGSAEPAFGAKLAAVFRPDDGVLGRLGHRRPGQRTAKISVVDNAGGTADVAIATKSARVTAALEGLSAPSSVFVPSREALAMYEGFIAAYTKRELAFDETYYDLAVALSAAALRGKPPKAIVDTVRDLETAIGGKVVLDGPRFYVRGEGQDLEAPLLSEGMRKLGSILRLLQNGELREAGLLLWDEPEANLNPKLSVVVARALARLASSGVQVIIASHDYILTETIALEVSRAAMPARFFALVREGNAAVVHGRDSLDELPANPIRAEFLHHYDRINEVEP